MWGGEFGRTPFREGRTAKGKVSSVATTTRTAFTMVLAGGGTEARATAWGETDELGFNVARDKVHVHDFHATLQHMLGFDHEKLTYRFQGRDFRLTDVHGHVVRDILA